MKYWKEVESNPDKYLYTGIHNGFERLKEPKTVTYMQESVLRSVSNINASPNLKLSLQHRIE